MLLFNCIANSLNGAVRKEFMASMTTETCPYRSAFARKYYNRGEAKGKIEGKIEGEAKGKIEGEAKGRAESLLLILKTRRRAVSKAQTNRILSCTDTNVLDQWLKKSLEISKVSELFDDKSHIS